MPPQPPSEEELKLHSAITRNFLFLHPTIKAIRIATLNTPATSTHPATQTAYILDNSLSLSTPAAPNIPDSSPRAHYLELSDHTHYRVLAQFSCTAQDDSVESMQGLFEQTVGGVADRIDAFQRYAELMEAVGGRPCSCPGGCHQDVYFAEEELEGLRRRFSEFRAPS